MQNQKLEAILLQSFEIEELEERLENKWTWTVAPSAVCTQRVPNTGATMLIRKDLDCPLGWVKS